MSKFDQTQAAPLKPGDYVDTDIELVVLPSRTGIYYGPNAPLIVAVENQQDRAEKYKSYVQGALRNPFYVGAHWFMYLDLNASGEPWGYNFQTGFVDICDTPYDEIVQAAREVGDILYEYRLKN